MKKYPSDFTLGWGGDFLEEAGSVPSVEYTVITQLFRREGRGENSVTHRENYLQADGNEERRGTLWLAPSGGDWCCCGACAGLTAEIPIRSQESLQHVNKKSSVGHKQMRDII